ARAGLGEVADARRAAALDGARPEGVGGARVGAAVAALREVAVASRGTADGRALRIGGAGGARSRAGLGEIADPGRAAAFDRARLEGVGGAGVGAAVAALRGVAVTRRGTRNGGPRRGG